MYSISKTFLSLPFIVFVSNWAFADTSLSLTEFLSHVETQSPEIKAEASLNAEINAKARGIRIPPPMVGLMRMNDAGGANQGFEISQEIPFPTKISTEKKARALEAKLQESTLTYRKSGILAQARQAYFAFLNAYEKNKTIKEKRDWLKKHARIAKSITRSDSTSQLHLLAIESDVDLLENEVLENESSLQQRKNDLRLFAPGLNVSEIEPATPPLNTPPLNPSSESLLVQLKKAELNAAETLATLKKQSYLPDVFVRYREYNGNQMTPKSAELMVGMTLPFAYFWQPQAESAEASARYQRAQAEFDQAQIQSNTKIKNIEIKLGSLQKQLTTLEKYLLPRAHKRMKLVDALSPRSMEGLDEHRSVMLNYLDLKLKIIDTRLEFETLLSELLALSPDEGIQK